jgi:hypothetical protein
MSPPSTQIKREMGTRLFGEFTDAIHRVIKTQRHYLTYLNSGQCNAWRIDQEVESANEAQRVAGDAYLKHINEHGCGTGT